MIPADEIHLWFCAHDFSREILAAYMGVRSHELRFSRGPFGKPRLEPRGGEGALSFNCSHAGGGHLLALSSNLDDNAIGADLVDKSALRNMREPDCRELLRDYFPRAVARNESCAQIFARLWTQCEALVKAGGRGLHDARIPAACCGIGTAESQWREVTFEGTIYQLIDFELDAYFHAAVAIHANGRQRRVRVFRAGAEDRFGLNAAFRAATEAPALAR